MKTFQEYETQATQTRVYGAITDAQRDRVRAAVYPHEPVDTQIDALINAVTGSTTLPIYPALGLCGEAGEFADKIKKTWRNGTPLDKRAALLELGDVLWYLSACARDLGSSLEEVAAMNVAKLLDRRARGVLKSEGDNR